MVDITQTRMQADEFLSLPESNLPTELIDGKVIMSPAPQDSHQAISRQFQRQGLFGQDESFESGVLGGKRMDLKGMFGA